jgi:hypothetical protein
VTTRVPTTSSREEKLLKKGKKEENVFDFFSYLIRFPDGWMDGCNSTKYTYGHSGFFPHAE